MRAAGAVGLIAALALLSARADAQNLELPALLYDYHELEPHFDNQTMRLHHLVLHASPPSGCQSSAQHVPSTHLGLHSSTAGPSPGISEDDQHCAGESPRQP